MTCWSKGWMGTCLIIAHQISDGISVNTAAPRTIFDALSILFTDLNHNGACGAFPDAKTKATRNQYSLRTENRWPFGMAQVLISYYHLQLKFSGTVDILETGCASSLIKNRRRHQKVMGTETAVP
ncbi:hypothetical protein IW261DRAFT_1594578 [Armillaria novae-zelandiae]|uniref:Uncharacterized protein n=1 Tax=Armillaria novae-zelandiae TaxID=153914 RepID=A0AA39UCM2_9AGAR|nr:hypothetical protein IW261DRAFT_1594578 [Armillaria novae-zelandiae]